MRGTALSSHVLLPRVYGGVTEESVPLLSEPAEPAGIISPAAAWKRTLRDTVSGSERSSVFGDEKPCVCVCV